MVPACRCRKSSRARRQAESISSAASFCSGLRFDLFGSLASRAAPTRQYLLLAVTSRLKLPLIRNPLLCQAAADLTGSFARSKQTFGSAGLTRVTPPGPLPSMRLSRTYLSDVFPGHWQRSLMMHFSHNGLRATQV